MDSTATKFSPHYLMFGREPNLPIDIEFGVRTPNLVATSTNDYVKKLQKRLAWAFKKAQGVNHKENKRNKKNYDRKVRCSKLEIEDKVLVRQKAFKKKHKIQDKWEEDIYLVVAQTNENFPVFIVLNEKSKKSKTLHRNMLFSLGQELQCEDIGHKVEASDSNENKHHTEEDSVESDLEEEQEYQGPVTKGKAKALEQANALMAHYFST